ncbi:MAG: hypothetical protein JJE52_17995 [Acidimicrobiia bacterium]|nr:hypothetical protein [Acidimicrobiia bacterium]
MAFSPFALLERDLTRRLLFGVLIVGATAAMVAVSMNGGSNTTATSERDPAIDALVPGNQADVLRQAQVGIDLDDGYMAALTLNGTLIPAEEISGDSGLGQYFFQPGPDRVVETLRSGLNCVSATYWRATEGPSQSRVTNWCFNAA